MSMQVALAPAPPLPAEWTKHKVPRLRSASPHYARDDSASFIRGPQAKSAGRYGTD